MSDYRYRITLDRHGVEEFDGDGHHYDVNSGNWIIDDASGSEAVINGSELVFFTRTLLKTPGDVPTE